MVDDVRLGEETDVAVVGADIGDLRIDAREDACAAATTLGEVAVGVCMEGVLIVLTFHQLVDGLFPYPTVGIEYWALIAIAAAAVTVRPENANQST